MHGLPPSPKCSRLQAQIFDMTCETEVKELYLVGIILIQVCMKKFRIHVMDSMERADAVQVRHLDQVAFVAFLDYLSYLSWEHQSHSNTSKIGPFIIPVFRPEHNSKI